MVRSQSHSIARRSLSRMPALRQPLVCVYRVMILSLKPSGSVECKKSWLNKEARYVHYVTFGFCESVKATRDIHILISLVSSHPMVCRKGGQMTEEQQQQQVELLFDQLRPIKCSHRGHW